MAGSGSRMCAAKSSLPGGKGKLSETSSEIFRMLSSGKTEEAILTCCPQLTHFDIAKAAREALLIIEAVQVRDERAEKMLRSYPRAFDKWTPDEERRVAELYVAGKTMREIAAAVKRQPNAIRNRLERIGMFRL